MYPLIRDHVGQGRLNTQLRPLGCAQGSRVAANPLRANRRRAPGRLATITSIAGRFPVRRLLGLARIAATLQRRRQEFLGCEVAGVVRDQGETDI